MPSFSFPPGAGGGGGGGAQTIGAKIHRTTSQPFVSGLEAAIAFDQVVYDSPSPFYAMFNPLFPARLTAPVKGKYLAVANFNWNENAVSLRRGVLYKNGVTPIDLDDKDAGTVVGVGTTNSLAMEVELDAGEWVEVHAAQFSGGGLSVEGGVSYSPNFAMRKVA